MEEAVAEPLRFPMGGLAIEAEALRPGDQVLGDEHQLEPHLVGCEVAEGQVTQPRRVAAADAVLDPGVGAVTRLQRRQIGVSLVGDEHLKAKPVVIGEGELSAGMGPLTPADGPGGGGPGAQIEVVQLADGGTVTEVAVQGDRGHPGVRGNRKHGLPNRLGEVEADGEADAALTQGIEEVVGGAGGVRTGQHRRIVLSPRRELLERGVEDPDVIAGMVGAGIAGTEQPGEDLVGLADAAEQRMEAEAALVRPGGALLVRVGGDQGGVEVKGDVIRTDAVLPSVGPSLGPGSANRGEVEVGGERVDPVGIEATSPKRSG